MATIASAALGPGLADPWAEAVRLAVARLDAAGAELRDALFLVPFAQQLPAARRAWAATGRWQPRIETTQTLAASLGPPEAPGEGGLRFDAALDRLAARRLLRDHAWAAAWARRDPRGYEQALASVVRVAHALARAAAAMAPDARADHWARARTALAGGAGPGATERLLGRVAVEWAAAAPRPATDALFALRPSAWVAVEAGGADPLTRSLLAAAPEGVPAILIEADPDPAVPFAGAFGRVESAACVDFEDEAQRTAAHVLDALCEGLRPVALIAQDRLLVRRVRALLARQDIPIQDETGWKLSTTRAGASIALLLAAARHDATCDDLLDWLKAASGDWPALGSVGPAVEWLESVLRKRAWSHPGAVDATALSPSSARLWEAADAVLARLRASPPQPLGAWLVRLAEALDASGALPFLRTDDAGRQVLEALHVEAAQAAPHAFGDEPLDFDDFAGWVDAALEEGTYRPAAPADAPVVITPLERATLRPFAAAVLAGADEKRLGAPPAPWPLLGDALAGELGLPTAAAQRERETLAFAHLLRVPRVVLLRRRDDGGEPLAPSPLLERLELAALGAGRPGLAEASDPRLPAAVAPHPTERPAPVLAGRLPARLSASAVEALRTCPYRFHALYGLRLREADELDDEVEKRDYGSWLHAVLHRFHAGRDAPDTAEAEAARLHAAAAAVREEMHLDAGAFLPFEASFVAFVPRYIDWLHGRDAEGARWLDGERELEAAPTEWRGVTMWGRVDRIDRAPGTAGVDVHVLDYKTGNADDLKKKAANPLEDTQLAFYAALVAAQDEPGGTLGAAYLTLDERDRISFIEHKGLENRGIADTALVLLRGVGGELDRIRAGAPLPALGEGQACDWCEARGLCRRDHWQPQPAAEETDG